MLLLICRIVTTYVRILCERDVDSLVSKFRQGYKGTGFESICVFSKVPLSDVATLLDPGENNLTALLPVRSSIGREKVMCS